MLHKFNTHLMNRVLQTRQLIFKRTPRSVIKETRSKTLFPIKYLMTWDTLRLNDRILDFKQLSERRLLEYHTKIHESPIADVYKGSCLRKKN